jgi:GDPmannose 4,6-dehydratase
LLLKGYEVHGIKRRSSSFNTSRIDHLFQDQHSKELDFKLRYGDMTDRTNLIRLMQEIQPDEIYNIAAQSHVHVSSDTPEHPADADGMGILRLLDSIRILGMEKKAGILGPSSICPKLAPQPICEDAILTGPFEPTNEWYAIANVAGIKMCQAYRKQYG